MRILVTGGAGFVGSHVVDLLVASGHEVVVLDSLVAHAAPPEYLDGSARCVWGDVCDPAAWRTALGDGVDAVCHQAARVGLGKDFSDVDGYVTDNDLGTAVGLRVLHQIGFEGRLVLASSMVVYGDGAYRCDEHGPVRPLPRRRQDLEAGNYEPGCPKCGRTLAWVAIDEDARLEPRSVYAATKLQQEHLAFTFGRDHDLPVVALRYHNVYGPRMPRDTPYSGVAAIFRSALEAARPPVVLEDGGQTRDFVHVSDVARANVRALTGPEAHGAFNVASGTPRTILELAQTLHLARGGAPETSPVVRGGHRPGDVRHIVASPARAAAELDFTASVDFERGIGEFAHAVLR